MSILNKSVLCLTGLWMPNGVISVKEALTAMIGGKEKPPAKGIDIIYNKNEDGTYDFDSQPIFNPLNWEDWINLELRDFDDVVHSKHLEIRVPTVIIQAHHLKPNEVIIRRPTKNAIRERDNNTCQVSGKKYPKKDLTIDHCFPKSRGGKDTWENQVTMHKKINFEKGDKTLQEAGLTLIKKPIAPAGIPMGSNISLPKDEDLKKDWKWFLIRK